MILCITEVIVAIINPMKYTVTPRNYSKQFTFSGLYVSLSSDIKAGFTVKAKIGLLRLNSGTNGFA